MNRYDVIAVGGGHAGCEAAGIQFRELNAAKPKLSTEELRDAVRAPGRIAGRAGVKEVLDAALAGFCIGK